MNVLWMTTDHQRWDTLNGRSECRTPNLQRLVNTGMTFDRAYAPMPVCCPVRAMWMSGSYPWHNGVHTQVHSAPSITRDMVPDVVTYSHRLREAGYRQGFVGKWHASFVRNPLDFGFDELAMPACCSPESLAGAPITAPPPLPDGLGDLTYHPGRTFQWPGSEPFDMWGTFSGPVEKLHTTRLADSAIDMIQRYGTEGRPWHVALHFPEPHDPYNPHAMYRANYDADTLSVPESFNDTFEGKPGMNRKEAQIWGPFDEQDVREGRAHYFAYCEQIDAQIGRVLDALEASGQAEDTMVVFTADHGDMLGAHHMWIKSWMPYEDVYHMPLIVCVPGTAPGVCEQLVQTHDVPHTILDLLGLPPLPHPDGHSLQPLLQDPSSGDWPDARLCVGYGCEFFVTQRMVITDDHKYVFNGFDVDELYDLRHDPHEMHNRIDDPAYAEIRRRLRGRLYELMNRYEDPYGDAGPGGCNMSKPNRYGAPRYLPRE